MSKQTFLQFLNEYKTDAGTMALMKQDAENKAAAKEKTATADAFSKEVSSTSPSKGALVRTGKGYYFVKGVSVKGIHVYPLGGDKNSETILPRGTYKYKMVEDPKYPNKSVYSISRAK